MKKLTAHDLSLFRERSIKNFVEQPSRCRLKGMDRDLTEEERRLLSMLDAASVTLANLGACDPDRAARIGMETYQYTNGHDQFDE